jgi:hypothetical protein
MPGQREDLVGLFDHVWDRFWRLGHIRRLLSEERNGAWLGRPAEPSGLAGRKAGR